MRILLVEDDRLIGEMVRLNLEQQGWQVTWEQNGEAGVGRLTTETFDLALLDVGLPGKTGFEIAQAARAEGRDLPILMLTARSDTASKVTGLDAGADDYLTKPFDVPELLARVRALVRRHSGDQQAVDSTIVSLGPCRADLQSGEAQTLTGPVQLTDAERRVLALLSRRRGQALPLTELLDELGADAEVTAAGLGSVEDLRETIGRLAAHFEPEPERARYFVVVPGGYRFES